MERALIAEAIVGLVAVAGITATVNVPIKRHLMTWNAAAPPQTSPHSGPLGNARTRHARSWRRPRSFSTS
jgi:hypothetical protein